MRPHFQNNDNDDNNDINDIHYNTDNNDKKYDNEGIYRGYVTLGNHGQHCALGTHNGQHYFDLGYDPQEDSSWFDAMIRPVEDTDVPPYYPMQGSNWGLTR